MIRPKIIILCVCLAFSLTSICHAKDNILGDKKGTAPNNDSPPSLLVPLATPNLEESAPYGIIRRVDVGNRKVVALSFDFCELATKTTGYARDLVEYLDDNNIPATMFLGGKWARTHSEREKQLFTNDLFEIGNHAWAHGNFALLDEKGMKEQIEYTQAQYDLLMQEIAESQNKEYIPKYLSLFRFPYGRSSEKALDILKSKNLWVIQWDVVGEPESDNTNPLAFEKVLAQARPGSIFLFHGNTIPKGTEFVVTRLVETLQSQGYEFTTVSKLLDMGKPEIVEDGYFDEPGDNIIYDDYFGTDGTGVRYPNSNN